VTRITITNTIPLTVSVAWRRVHARDHSTRCRKARAPRVRSGRFDGHDRHDRDLDQHRHGRAHIHSQYERLELRNRHAGRSFFVYVPDAWHVCLSLRDSPGNDRYRRRPLIERVMADAAFRARLSDVVAAGFLRAGIAGSTLGPE